MTTHASQNPEFTHSHTKHKNAKSTHTIVRICLRMPINTEYESVKNAKKINVCWGKMLKNLQITNTENNFSVLSVFGQMVAYRRLDLAKRIRQMTLKKKKQQWENRFSHRRVAGEKNVSKKTKIVWTFFWENLVCVMLHSVSSPTLVGCHMIFYFFILVKTAGTR